MKKTNTKQPQEDDDQQTERDAINEAGQENTWKEEVQRSRRWGYLFFALALIAFVVYLFKFQPTFFGWSSIIALVMGILFYLPVNYYIFDNAEYEPNTTVADFVEKLRFRAILFNNLSVLTFIVTVFVIVCSFYLMIHTQTASAPPGTNMPADAVNTTEPSNPDYSRLATQIGAVVVLIFLVQILFRVFKYLLRVGAFYNGKADAIELSGLDPKYDLNTLLDELTPTSYNISDVDSPNLFAKP